MLFDHIPVLTLKLKDRDVCQIKGIVLLVKENLFLMSKRMDLPANICEFYTDSSLGVYCSIMVCQVLLCLSLNRDFEHMLFLLSYPICLNIFEYFVPYFVIAFILVV